MQVNLPPNLFRIMSSMSLVINVGVGSSATLFDCLGMGGYRSQLILYGTIPFVAAGAVLLFIVLRTLCKRSFKRLGPINLLMSFLPWVIRIQFISYPVVTNVGAPTRACFDAARLVKRSLALRDVALLFASPASVAVAHCAQRALSCKPRCHTRRSRDRPLANHADVADSFPTASHSLHSLHSTPSTAIRLTTQHGSRPT